MPISTIGTNGLGASLSFTTPALGTPASGVMTNVTSLPAAQLTGSRTIPVGTVPAGSVLQVVSATKSGESSTSSTTFVDANLSVTITPTSATSKIFVIYTGTAGNNGSPQSFLTILRGATNLGNGNQGMMRIWINSSSSYNFGGMSMSILDSPATTSATTYKVQFRTTSSTVYISADASTDSITVMEIAA
jgi:hypothetical protein